MKNAILLILTLIAATCVAAIPDLSVSSIEVSDLSPAVENATANLKITIDNNGNETATLFYYQLNITGETSRELIFPSLAANTSYLDIVPVAFSSAGAKNITVSVDSRDKYNETNETDNTLVQSVTVVAPSSSISMGTGAISMTAVQGTTSVSETITVTNDGNVDISNISMSITDLEDGSKDISGNSVTLNPASFSLDVGASKDMTITVPLDATQPVDTYTGTLTATYDGSKTAQRSVTVSVSKPPTTSKLEIKRVKIAVGEDAEDDDFSSYSYGEEEKIAPDDKIKFEVIVENTDNDDLEIEDINVEIEIDGSDWDEKEDDDTDDLDAGDDNDKEPVEFSFTVDDEVEDDDEYDVTITVDGRDKDGEVHRDTFIATLKVEQESDDLRIKSFVSDKSKVTCGGSAKLTAKIENKGKSRQRHAYMTLKSSQLGIDSVLSEMSIDESGDSDDEITKTVNLNFASKTDLDGTYTVVATVYDDDGDKMDTDSVALIFDCQDDAKTSSTTGSTATGLTSNDDADAINGTYTKANATESIESGFRGSTSYVAVLAILAIVIIGMGAFLVIKFW